MQKPGIAALQHTQKKKFLKNLDALYTPGSDLVDAEKTGIKIVLAPYVLAIKDSPKFYKPGLPFEVTVTYIHSTKKNP